MVHDHISDLVTRIRNAARASLSTFLVPRTKVSISILHLLFKEGFISGYHIKDAFSIEVFLAYSGNKPVIQNIRRVSTPGHRIYWSLKKLQRMLQFENNIVYILSSSHGIVLSSYADLFGVGGEVICKVS